MTPTGTVTFLFTDIEGSTSLWEQHPDAMSEGQAAHDRMLREAIAANSGYVFSSAGDGVGAAFVSASSALAAALGLQDDIGSFAWPAPIGELRVRMGLHAGTAVERNGDYFGTAVNRAARVAAAANGGQVLASSTVRSLLLDEPGAEWTFTDLGKHPLKGLVRPERLWQVDPLGSAAAVQAARVVEVRGNLPPPRREVFGRADDVAGILGQLEMHRLVTLTGVGGVGKTTLALDAAREAASTYPGGAWFVDLAATDDADLVPAVVATALRLTQRPGMSLSESIADGLRLSRSLVVLDNAEQVVGAVAGLVDELLGLVSDVSLVVTSREPLAIDGERLKPVSPLAFEGGAESPAVRFFTERVRRLAPGFLPTADDIRAMEEISRRLDGLPLGIELAASQCEFLTPTEVLRGLASAGLRLEATTRSGAERHRTLERTIGWSYDRRPDAERRVFERLSVFTGGCSWDAALAVCGGADSDVSGALRNLIRTSMVTFDRAGGGTRLRLLETLRGFAASRLEQHGDPHETRARHASFYADMAAENAAGLVGPDEARCLEAIRIDLDNLRSAVAWATEHARDLLAKLVAFLPYVVSGGMLEWIEEALSALEPDEPARVQLAQAEAIGLALAGRYDEVPRRFAAATDALPDGEVLGVIRAGVGLVTSMYQGDLAGVIATSPPVFDAAMELDLTLIAGSTAADLALAQLSTGDQVGAGLTADRLLDYAARTGNPTLLVWAGYTKGEVVGASDPAAAMVLLEEAVEHALSVGNDFGAGVSLVALSSIAGRAGRLRLALDGMDRCIRVLSQSGNRPVLWTAARNLVEILGGLGLDEDALVLDAAIDASTEGAPELFGPHGERYRSLMRNVEDRLDEATVRASRDAGARFQYRDAVDFALGSIERAKSAL